MGMEAYGRGILRNGVRSCAILPGILGFKTQTENGITALVPVPLLQCNAPAVGRTYGNQRVRDAPGRIGTSLILLSPFSRTHVPRRMPLHSSQSVEPILERRLSLPHGSKANKLRRAFAPRISRNNEVCRARCDDRCLSRRKDTCDRSQQWRRRKTVMPALSCGTRRTVSCNGRSRASTDQYGR